MTIRVQVIDENTNLSRGRYTIPEEELEALKIYLIRKSTESLIFNVLSKSILEPDEFRPWSMK